MRTFTEYLETHPDISIAYVIGRDEYKLEDKTISIDEREMLADRIDTYKRILMRKSILKNDKHEFRD